MKKPKKPKKPEILPAGTLLTVCRHTALEREEAYIRIPPDSIIMLLEDLNVTNMSERAPGNIKVRSFRALYEETTGRIGSFWSRAGFKRKFKKVAI